MWWTFSLFDVWYLEGGFFWFVVLGCVAAASPFRADGSFFFWLALVFLKWTWILACHLQWYLAMDVGRRSEEEKHLRHLWSVRQGFWPLHH
jgi:hypothetical protein